MATPKQVLNQARQLFATKPEWQDFFRDVLGVDGLVMKAYPQLKSRVLFTTTPEYSEIQGMLKELRSVVAESTMGLDTDGSRVITVRLPAALHDSLRAEAHAYNTSLNKLCVTKLLQPVLRSLVPTDSKIPKRLPSHT